jgi:predicted nuclease of predicted toxin-antitoxin system
MARLLVDMNLSTERIPLLRAAGHEAVHWSEVGDPMAPDTALMQWAIANSYAVFTHDLDFGTMLALSGADGPSVLQVRSLNVLPEAIGTLVLSLLKTYGVEGRVLGKPLARPSLDKPAGENLAGLLPPAWHHSNACTLATFSSRVWSLSVRVLIFTVV